ncbi:MAG: KamA family radical SAM protein [Deltaproteobacteria bacterium]|nr:KamA family radical SAM protein [Deltaproteobacteria bacterium]
MDHARAKQRLIRILGIAPELREIMLSTLPLEEKRKKIREFIVNLISFNFNDDTAIEPLEWVVTRDAIRVLRSIFSTRNERLVGKSLLKYMDDLLHLDTLKGMEKPSSGFFAELEHLLKGLMGKAGIYTEKVPVFSKHQGTKAARLRSADLSQMTRKSQRFLDRYPCGLDSDAIHRRSINKARILNHFGATELEWEDWKWHSRHIIRDADTLNDLVKLNEEEFQAVMLAREHKIPFGITPYYLSLIDNNSDHSRDYAVRAQVIPSLSYVQAMKTAKEAEEHSMDFMLERDTSPIEGITRRYPMIAILKPISTCPQICVYCQRNWEIEDVHSSNAVLTKEKLEKAFQWLADTPEVIEVLITGGDPFLLSNKKIEYLLSRLSRIKHIQRIRIGTRTLVTLPQRINESLVRVINRFHSPGKREILIITHFEHPYEITLQSMEAVQKFRHYGIDVYNQLVYTFYNSRKFEASALRLKLRSIGVTPYYTFNTKGKEETNEYRVPIPRLLQEQKEEARMLPGSVRTDEIVFNVPGLGKNYLRASQHRDIISILPDGRRVYEFHPWEKQLSLVDTYLYNDVSIYDYLKRLKAAGEDTSQYKTIWYYY